MHYSCPTRRGGHGRKFESFVGGRSEGAFTLRPRHLLCKLPAEASPTKTFKCVNAAEVNIGLQSTGLLLY